MSCITVFQIILEFKLLSLVEVRKLPVQFEEELNNDKDRPFVLNIVTKTTKDIKMRSSLFAITQHEKLKAAPAFSK